MSPEHLADISMTIGLSRIEAWEEVIPVRAQRAAPFFACTRKDLTKAAFFLILTGRFEKEYPRP
jgi:hypothetical protein